MFFDEDDLFSAAKAASAKKAELVWRGGKFDEEGRAHIRALPESNIPCPDCGLPLRKEPETQNEYYCLGCESVFSQEEEPHMAANDWAEADFEAVAQRLHVDGIAEAEVQASGGGIDVIRIPVAGKYVMYFGTAGEVWGASVYRTGPDGDEIGDPVDDVWTNVASGNTDADAVAAGIAEAVTRYRGI